MALYPRLQASAQVSQRKRFGGTIHQIGFAHCLKSPLTDDCPKTGKIFIQGSEHAKPVLAVVEFEAVTTAPAIVGRVVHRHHPLRRDTLLTAQAAPLPARFGGGGFAPTRGGGSHLIA